MGLVTVSQAIAHGITKTGVAVEMIDLRSADLQEVKELVSIAAGLVIGTPPTTGAAAAQTAISTILATAKPSSLLVCLSLGVGIVNQFIHC
jgi:flavorubredoxin